MGKINNSGEWLPSIHHCHTALHPGECSQALLDLRPAEAYLVPHRYRGQAVGNVKLARHIDGDVMHLPHEPYIIAAARSGLGDVRSANVAACNAIT